MTVSKDHPGSLQDVDKHFRLLVQSAKDFAIFGLDLEGRITSWNEGAERMKGYTADEAIGEHLRMLFLPEDRAAGNPEKEMEHALREEVFSGEEQRMRKNGEIFDALVTLHVLRNDAGEAVGFVKVTEDITPRKERERELAAERELVEVMMAIVAHDLRNPIHAIQFAADAVTKQIGERSKVSPMLPIIARAAARAERIVADLLDLSKARLGGGFAVERTEEDAAMLAEQVAEEYRLVHPERTIVVHARGDTTAAIDRSRFLQSIANLIANALVHGAPCSPISVDVIGDAGTLVVEVHNHGAVISPNVAGTLFNAFRRGGKRASDRGLGLGLYIVDRIAAAHGGKVTVESQEGRGTTFRMTLPRV